MLVTKVMSSYKWSKEENGGQYQTRNDEDDYQGGMSSRMSTHHSHFPSPRGGPFVPAEIHTRNITNEVQSGNVVLHQSNINVQQYNNLQMQLDQANNTIENLKKMLVKSYSDYKTRNLRRDVTENSARISKVCREVVWPRVKFAPDSAFASFSKRSIFDMIITNCNLDEDEDEILFWCSNKDYVKDSLYQHRSNVTSRIKLQFRKGKNYICT